MQVCAKLGLMSARMPRTPAGTVSWVLRCSGAEHSVGVWPQWPCMELRQRDCCVQLWSKRREFDEVEQRRPSSHHLPLLDPTFLG